MSIHVKERLHLPSELTALCEAMPVPVTIVDPRADDMPIAYSNPAFQKLTGRRKEDITGRNCRFLQGPDTDRTVTDELAVSCSIAESNAACLINYRADGTRFLNLLAIQKIHEPRQKPFLMGCQIEFCLVDGADCDIANASKVDHAWRQLRRGHRLNTVSLDANDIYRLDAISMRFDSAFIRAQNVLIQRATHTTRRKITTDWMYAQDAMRASAAFGC